MKKWYSVREAAEYTGYSRGYLDNLRGKGKGPKYVHTGSGSIRYRVDWLDEWIEGPNQAADTPSVAV